MEELFEIRALVAKLESAMKEERRRYMERIALLGEKIALLESLLEQNDIEY